MKKVLLKKRKYTPYDILKLAGLVLYHYFLFYIYYTTIFGIQYALKNDIWSFSDLKAFSIYAALVAPALSAILHAIYSEGGYPWLRAMIWVHAIFIVIMVPIFQFI